MAAGVAARRELEAGRRSGSRAAGRRCSRRPAPVARRARRGRRRARRRVHPHERELPVRGGQLDRRLRAPQRVVGAALPPRAVPAGRRGRYRLDRRHVHGDLAVRAARPVRGSDRHDGRRVARRSCRRARSCAWRSRRRRTTRRCSRIRAGSTRTGRPLERGLARRRPRDGAASHLGLGLGEPFLRRLQARGSRRAKGSCASSATVGRHRRAGTPLRLHQSPPDRPVSTRDHHPGRLRHNDHRLPEVPRPLAAVSEHPVPPGRGAAADAAQGRRPPVRRLGSRAGQRDAVVDVGVDAAHQLRHVLCACRMLVRSGRPSEPRAVLHPRGHAPPLQPGHVRRGRAPGGGRLQHPRVVASPRVQLRRRGLLHRLVGAGEMHTDLFKQKVENDTLYELGWYERSPVVPTAATTATRASSPGSTSFGRGRGPKTTST